MPIARRGEVWLADLGWAAKVRPVLILSVPYSGRDYALRSLFVTLLILLLPLCIILIISCNLELYSPR